MNKVFQAKVYRPVKSTYINYLWQGDFEGDFVNNHISAWRNYWASIGTPTMVDRCRTDSYGTPSYGTALTFNGYSSYASISRIIGINGVTLNNQPYVAFMTKLNMASWAPIVQQDIIGCYGVVGGVAKGYGIAINYTAGNLSAIVGLGGGTLTEAAYPLASISAGTHTIGMKYDGTNLKLFVDGVAVATTAAAGSISFSGMALGASLGVGATTDTAFVATAPVRHWQGTMDNLCVYLCPTTGVVPADTDFQKYNDNAVPQIQAAAQNLTLFYDFNNLLDSADVPSGTKVNETMTNINLMTLNHTGYTTGLTLTTTSAKITTNTGGSADQGIGITTNKPALVPGQTYIVSAMVQAASGKTIRLKMTPSGGGSTVTKDLVAAGGIWQRISLTFTAAAGATSAEIDVLMIGASGAVTTFYVDCVMMTNGSSLVEPFNFNTPDSALAKYRNNTTSRTITATIQEFQYIKTWTDLASDPNYDLELNTSGAAIDLDLARPADNFGEGDDVDFNNRVDIYVISDTYPQGLLKYCGKIMDYTPKFGSDENVRINLLSYGDDMQQLPYQGGASEAASLVNSAGTVGINGNDGTTFGLYYSFIQAVTTDSDQTDLTAMWFYLYIDPTTTAFNPLATTFTLQIDLFDDYTAASDYLVNKATPINYPRIATMKATIPANSNTIGWVRFDVLDANDLPTAVRLNPSQKYYAVGASFPPTSNGSAGNVRYSTWFGVSTDYYAGGGLNLVHDGTPPTVLGTAAYNLCFKMEKSYGATRTDVNSVDPSTALKMVIDDLNRQGCMITYDDTTIEMTGTIVSYDFNTLTGYEAWQACLKLAPANWITFIDMATLQVHLHPRDSATTYRLQMGRDVYLMQPFKRLENIINTVYFTGGPDPLNSTQNLFKKFYDQASIDAFGMRAIKYTDSRVTKESTMQIIANALIRGHNAPQIQAEIDIIDGDIDIEVIRPGDLINVRGVTLEPSNNVLGAFILGQSYLGFDIATIESMWLPIARLSYKGDTLRVVLDSSPNDVNKRVEDIARNLESQQVLNNPSVAST